MAGKGKLVTNFTESGESPCSARTEAVSRYRMFFGALIATVRPVRSASDLTGGVRHHVDALGPRLHDRSLGEDVQAGLARGLGLDVGDVVAAGDVVLALDLPVGHRVAAGGGREADVQALLGRSPGGQTMLRSAAI
jgi:hypothetical protein